MYLVLVASVVVAPLYGADHGDAPYLAAVGRTDAQITDLFAFLRGEDNEKLVLVLCTNPAIPRSVTTYRFAPDLTLRFHIDHHSAVRFDDPLDLTQLGGTIVHPEAVAEDVILEVTFDDDGVPQLHTQGIAGTYRRQLRLFAGLRDDPFIRRPRAGRNVAAVVIELPVEAVLGPQPELLIWATTKVPDIQGPISEHAGRALRSMLIDEAGLPAVNMLRPRDHWRILDIAPDAMIFDVPRPAAFPNGRELTDDVIALAAPGGTLPMEGSPRNTVNDVPFLGTFPYLAEPHAAPAP